MKAINTAILVNASESPKPLLTLVLEIDKTGYKKNPIMFTEEDREDTVKYFISFLTPEDLDKISAAIEFAKEAGFDNHKMGIK